MATRHKTRDGERLPRGMVQIEATERIDFEMRGEGQTRVEAGEVAVVPASVGRTADAQGKGRIVSKPLNVFETCEPLEGETETDAENQLRRMAGVREVRDPSEVDEMDLWRYYAGLGPDPRYK